MREHTHKHGKFFRDRDRMRRMSYRMVVQKLRMLYGVSLVCLCVCVFVVHEHTCAANE